MHVLKEDAHSLPHGPSCLFTVVHPNSSFQQQFYEQGNFKIKTLILCICYGHMIYCKPAWSNWRPAVHIQPTATCNQISSKGFWQWCIALEKNHWTWL